MRRLCRCSRRPTGNSSTVGCEPRDTTRGGVNAPALPAQRGRERPLSIDPSVVELREPLLEAEHDLAGLVDEAAGGGEVALELDDLALALGDVAARGAQRGLQAVALGGGPGALGLGAAQLGGGLGALGGGLA